MSEAQNVQRGVVMIWFIHAVLFMVSVLYKLVKGRLDPVEEEEDPNKAQKYKDSHEQIG